MTDNTKKNTQAKTTATKATVGNDSTMHEKVGASFTKQSQAPTRTPLTDLVTSWTKGDDEVPDFDVDQVDVHAWASTEGADAREVLKGMTLDDIEELIFSAERVAEEHVKRAKAARELARTVAKRLGQASAAHPDHSFATAAPTTEIPARDPQRDGLAIGMPTA